MKAVSHLATMGITNLLRSSCQCGWPDCLDIGLWSHYWTARWTDLLDLLFINFIFKSIQACKWTNFSPMYTQTQVTGDNSAHTSTLQCIQNRSHLLSQPHQSLNYPGLRSQSYSFPFFRSCYVFELWSPFHLRIPFCSLTILGQLLTTSWIHCQASSLIPLKNRTTVPFWWEYTVRKGILWVWSQVKRICMVCLLRLYLLWKMQFNYQLNWSHFYSLSINDS